MVPPAMNTGMFAKVNITLPLWQSMMLTWVFQAPSSRPPPLRWAIEVFNVPIVIRTARPPAIQNAFISFLFIFSVSCFGLL